MKWPIPCLLLCVMLAPIAARAEVRISTTNLNLEFSDSGVLVAAQACYPDCAADPDGGNAKRGGFGGSGQAVVDHHLAPGGWTLTPVVEGGDRVLTFDSGAGEQLTWRIPDQGYRVHLELEGDTGLSDLWVRSGADFRPRPSTGFGPWLERIRYMALPGRKADFGGASADLDLEEEWTWHTDGWTGFRNRYWALMVRPEQPAEVEPLTGPGRQDAGLDIAPQAARQAIDIYLGPVEPAALASADPALGHLMFSALWFWLRWICFGLMWLLGAIHSVVGVLPASFSWGVSIILLSLAVHVLMRPLTRIADRLQDQVHATEARLAPELSEIRKVHKGEQQAERILALYKREGVHPLYSLKSLLGVAIVIPVFIGAFDMLAENIHLLGVPFLWIADLSRPDAVASLPFDPPFFGASLNLLPFLMTGLSILASWLHRPPQQHPDLRRKQLRNMFLLAAAFFVLFYTFPSGMVLYWTTNNLISAVKGGWHHFHRPGNGAEPGGHG